MNIRCPACDSVFRVDPEKVPAAGVKARCTKCQATFRLDRNGASPLDAPQPAFAGAGLGADTPRPSTLAQDRTYVAAQAPAAVRPLPEMPSLKPSVAATGVTTPRRPSFLNQDPGARAQRIARALVSDIVAYNKERLQASIESGSLRNDFREEIRKSWEEYVEQVGLEMAKQAPYFRDALNDILAKGQKVF